jgi:carboxyl-terminal processing protease
MPDIFVAADTSYSTQYFSRLLAKNVLNTYALEYYDKNRAQLNSRFKTFNDYKNGFSLGPDDIKAFIQKGESEGVKFNEDQFNRSRNEILLVLKGLIATNIWKTSEYFEIINADDKVIEDARKILSDKNAYNNTLGYR